MDHILKRIDEMTERLQVLLEDLEYLKDETHGLMCALTEAESERDHNDNMYDKAQTELEELQAEKKERNHRAFVESLIATANIPPAVQPSKNIGPAGPIWAQEEDGQP